MAESPDRARLRQVVLDTSTPRALAEFYRELLGWAYRPGDEPSAAGQPESPEADWLVLVDEDAGFRLAFQGVPELPEVTWPEGPHPALRRARAAGLRVAVFTNGDDDHQRFKLAKLGVADDIDVLVSSSTLTASKPDPQAFTEAMARVGVSPAEALMVGNSLDDDVRGALAGGIGAVWLDRADKLPDATVRRIRSLDELTFGGLNPA